MQEKSGDQFFTLLIPIDNGLWINRLCLLKKPVLGHRKTFDSYITAKITHCPMGSELLNAQLLNAEGAW